MVLARFEQAKHFSRFVVLNLFAVIERGWKMPPNFARSVVDCFGQRQNNGRSQFSKYVEAKTENTHLKEEVRGRPEASRFSWPAYGESTRP